jgi:cytidylate kinase
LKEKGIGANLTDLSADLAERDRRDSERATAPLKPAADAVVVDSTGLDIPACLERCLAVVRQRLP